MTTTRLIRWFVGRYGVDMSEAAEPDIASYGASTTSSPAP